MPKNYRAHFNTTWADFDLKKAQPENIPAFNTPEWKANFTLSNDRVTERFGFSVADHWQKSFDWYGTLTQLAPGKVKSFRMIDAQASYRVPAMKTTFKLGANNLFNQKLVTANGSPAQRGMYYVSLVFDEMMR